MTRESHLAAKRNSFERMKKYQLPNRFKKIGWGIGLISLLCLLLLAFFDGASPTKLLAKYGMLVGLLLVSISKEKVEDELIVKLRIQSYTIAFIIAVLYALCIPIIAYTFDYFFDSTPPELEGIGDFMILWILLSLQVFYFEVLKRWHQ